MICDRCGKIIKTVWIVVNIGCIECGVSSDIVGVFESKEKANLVADRCCEKYNWREDGQNNFEVFPMPELNKINKNYKEVIGAEYIKEIVE